MNKVRRAATNAAQNFLNLFIEGREVTPGERHYDRIIKDHKEAKNFKLTDEIRQNVQKSFGAPLKTPMVVDIPDSIEYASAIGQFREFREDHTGPALTKKFIKDIIDHANMSEYPSILLEIASALSARLAAERNVLQQNLENISKEGEHVRSIEHEFGTLLKKLTDGKG